MHDTVTVQAVQSAERRVEEARIDFFSQVDALESRARRFVTSPLVVGAVIAATAATAYLVVAQRGKPKPPILTAPSGSRLLNLLKAAQVLIAVSGAVAGLKAASRDAGVRHVLTGKFPPVKD